MSALHKLLQLATKAATDPQRVAAEAPNTGRRVQAWLRVQVTERDGTYPLFVYVRDGGKEIVIPRDDNGMLVSAFVDAWDLWAAAMRTWNASVAEPAAQAALDSLKDA